MLNSRVAFDCLAPDGSLGRRSCLCDEVNTTEARGEHQWDVESHVEVVFGDEVTYGDIAPLLDVLASKVFTVKTSRDAWRGPMGDGIEVGLVILTAAVLGGAAFTKRFCELLAEDAHAAFRRLLLGLVERLRGDEYRPLVPFAISVGAIRFYFDGESTGEIAATRTDWTDERLTQRLFAAQRVVDEAPAVLLEHPLDDFLEAWGFDLGARYELKDAGYVWDERGKRWLPNEPMQTLLEWAAGTGNRSDPGKTAGL